MIERLKNCPNCGGLLDDFGSCQFCGSKVYDLCDIDVRYRSARKGRTYLRIMTDTQLILAPVITNTISITCERDAWPVLEAEFVVCGDITAQEVNDEKDMGC